MAGEEDFEVVGVGFDATRLVSGTQAGVQAMRGLGVEAERTMATFSAATAEMRADLDQQTQKYKQGEISARQYRAEVASLQQLLNRNVSAAGPMAGLVGGSAEAGGLRSALGSAESLAGAEASGLRTARALERVGLASMTMASGLGQGSMGLRSIGFGLMTLLPGLGAVTAAVVLAAGAYEMYSRRADEAAKHTVEMNEALRKQYQEAAGGPAQRDFVTRNERIERLRAHQDELQRAITGAETAVRVRGNAYLNAGGAPGDPHTDELDAYNSALDRLNTLRQRLTLTTAGLGEAEQSLAEKVRNTIKEERDAETYTEALQRARNPKAYRLYGEDSIRHRGEAESEMDARKRAAHEYERDQDRLQANIRAAVYRQLEDTKRAREQQEADLQHKTHEAAGRAGDDVKHAFEQRQKSIADTISGGIDAGLVRGRQGFQSFFAEVIQQGEQALSKLVGEYFAALLTGTKTPDLGILGGLFGGGTPSALSGSMVTVPGVPGGLPIGPHAMAGGGGGVVHQHFYEIHSPDSRGIGEFFANNQPLIAEHAVRGILKSRAATQALRGSLG